VPARPLAPHVDCHRHEAVLGWAPLRAPLANTSRWAGHCLRAWGRWQPFELVAAGAIVRAPVPLYHHRSSQLWVISDIPNGTGSQAFVEDLKHQTSSVAFLNFRQGDLRLPSSINMLLSDWVTSVREMPHPRCRCSQWRPSFGWPTCC
jgi:hypothetical protein